jgi:hypothetical protein
MSTLEGVKAHVSCLCCRSEMEWDAAFLQWYEASRRASGVPFHITDPAILARIATLAFGPPERGDAV